MRKKWKRYLVPLVKPSLPSPPRRILTSADIHSWLERNDLSINPTPPSDQRLVPFDFELEREVPTKTVLQLKTRFYKWHTDKTQKAGWPHPVLKGMDPIALELNPTLLESADPLAGDKWFAVYYRNYFVTIEQSVSHPLQGPHVAMLHIKAAKLVWLGTMQLMFQFFNEDKLRICLRRAIRLREYFTSERTENMPVELI